MNFSNFTKQKISKTSENINNEEGIKDKYQKYSNMDSGQLMNELLSTVNNQKKDGTFDFDSLSNTLDSIKTSMPQETYENVKRLLNQIK